MTALSRRAFLLLAGMLTMPRWARGQAAPRVYRLGWLGSIDSSKEPYSVAFVQRLRELGFADGGNLAISRRHAGGRIEKLPSVAAELARLNVDVFFGAGPEASLSALKQTGGDWPIVFVAVDFDPVAGGYVANPARPGGRITGVTAVQSVLPGKRLELVKELLPATRKVAVMGNDQTTGQFAVAGEAAKRLGLELHVIHFKRQPFDYEAAIAEAVQARSEVLFVFGSALFVPARRLIPELALKARLPSVFHHAQWVEAGGLMSYGFNFPQMWRSAADQVAKILRGTKVGIFPWSNRRPTSSQSTQLRLESSASGSRSRSEYGSTVSSTTSSPGAVFVCAHGAGGHKDDRGMVALAEALGGAGFEVVRFNFPYRDRGSKLPDPMPVLKESIAATVARVRSERKLIIGGRSMGGRAASMLAADGFECDGLLLLAYPLHPAGKPEKLRDAHLPQIRVPVLCFNGTRDALCRRDLMEKALEKLSWQMHWLEGAGHSFRARDYKEIAEVSHAWLSRLA